MSSFDDLPDMPNLDDMANQHEPGAFASENAPVSNLIDGISATLALTGVAGIAGLALGLPLIVGFAAGVAAVAGIGIKTLDYIAHGQRGKAIASGILAASVFTAGVAVGIYKEANPMNKLELKESFTNAGSKTSAAEKNDAENLFKLPELCERTP